MPIYLLFEKFSRFLDFIVEIARLACASLTEFYYTPHPNSRYHIFITIYIPYNILYLITPKKIFVLWSVKRKYNELPPKNEFLFYFLFYFYAELEYRRVDLIMKSVEPSFYYRKLVFWWYLCYACCAHKYRNWWQQINKCWTNLFIYSRPKLINVFGIIGPFFYLISLYTVNWSKNTIFINLQCQSFYFKRTNRNIETIACVVSR